MDDTSADSAMVGSGAIANSTSTLNISGGVNYLGSQVNYSRHPDQEAAERRDKVIASLAFKDEYARLDQVADAYPGTYEWIFDDTAAPWDSFLQWLQSDDGLYWIHGKAGSGKSTLMRFLAENSRLTEHLKHWSHGADIAILTHFFWRAGTADQKNLSGLLRSLLRQALLQLPQLENAIMDALLRRSFRWTVTDLLISLRQVLSAGNTPCAIFIDGVDEFEANQALITKLMNLIIELAQMPQLKFCLSSRPEGAISNHLVGTKQLRLQDLTKDDFTQFVYGRLRRLPYFQWLEQNQWRDTDSLTTRLIQQADGVFLWLHLAVENFTKGLNQKDSLEILGERLEKLGSNLHELFTFIISQVDDVYIETMTKTLALMAECTSRDHSVNLLAAIQRIEPDVFGPALSHLVPGERLTAADAAEMFTRCQDVVERIISQGAGLFDVVQTHDHRVGLCIASGFGDCICTQSSIPFTCIQSRLHGRRVYSHFRSKNLCFIHRDAYEFLVNFPGKLSECVQQNSYVSSATLITRVDEVKARLACTLDSYLSSVTESCHCWSTVDIANYRDFTAAAEPILKDWDVHLDYLCQDISESIEAELRLLELVSFPRQSLLTFEPMRQTLGASRFYLENAISNAATFMARLPSRNTGLNTYSDYRWKEFEKICAFALARWAEFAQKENYLDLVLGFIALQEYHSLPRPECSAFDLSLQTALIDQSIQGSRLIDVFEPNRDVHYRAQNFYFDEELVEDFEEFWHEGMEDEVRKLGYQHIYLSKMHLMTLPSLYKHFETYHASLLKGFEIRLIEYMRDISSFEPSNQPYQQRFEAILYELPGIPNDLVLTLEIGLSRAMISAHLWPTSTPISRQITTAVSQSALISGAEDHGFSFQARISALFSDPKTHAFGTKNIPEMQQWFMNWLEGLSPGEQSNCCSEIVRVFWRGFSKPPSVEVIDRFADLLFPSLPKHTCNNH